MRFQASSRGGTRWKPSERSWCNASVTRALALIGAAAVALVLVSSVEAAAPRYILVSGPVLERPVLLADLQENRALFAALATAPKAQDETVRRLHERPRLRLGLFYGWSEKRRPTRPSQANQKGWFYPAWRSQRALVDLLVNSVRAPRIAPSRVLRILARHDIPTRLSVPTPPPEPEQPTLCSAEEVEKLTQRFLAAFNGGDLGALAEFFAREPDFDWYSTDGPGERLVPLAYERDSLVSYFAGRHALGERLELRTFRFNGNTAATRPYGNFLYSLTRSAHDLAPTPYEGKGAASCYRERADVIFVWLMRRQ